MEPIHPSLIGVPPETLNKICKFLGYKQIMGLRPVCRRLKNYVDNFRPDFGSEMIRVLAIENFIQVCFDNISGKTECIKCVDGDEYQWKPLEIILAHQKSPIEFFSMCAPKTKNPKRFTQILENIEPCLKTRSSPLHVQETLLEVRNENDVINILPYFDPRFLQSVTLTFHTLNRNERGTLEMGRIKKLEHWKTASRFYATGFLVDARIEEFEHFEKFQITIDTLKMSDAVALKEKMFTSSIKTTYANIFYRNLEKDAEVPEGYLPIDESEPDVYRYPIGDGEEKRLRFELIPKELHIEMCQFSEGEWSPAY